MPVTPDMARASAKQILDELAASDPQFAAEQCRHEREMKAWRRERKLLCSEVSRLQIPFVIAAVNIGEKYAAVGDMAGVILRVSDYLYQQDAPADLIRDLLQTCQRMLSMEPMREFE